MKKQVYRYGIGSEPTENFTLGLVLQIYKVIESQSPAILLLCTLVHDYHLYGYKMAVSLTSMLKTGR
jgi:hypothetical protein